MSLDKKLSAVFVILLSILNANGQEEPFTILSRKFTGVWRNFFVSSALWPRTWF